MRIGASSESGRLGNTDLALPLPTQLPEGIAQCLCGELVRLIPHRAPSDPRMKLTAERPSVDPGDAARRTSTAPRCRPRKAGAQMSRPNFGNVVRRVDWNDARVNGSGSSLKKGR